MTVFVSFTVAGITNQAIANVAWLSLDPDYVSTDRENDGAICLEALMKGNLLHLEGKEWHNSQRNIHFLSFYDNKVFSFYGYSGDLVCNRQHEGAGKLRTKGLMDDEWSSD